MNTLVITATILSRTALHVGAGLSSSEADSLLRRNARGEVFLPGSAIAGALRAMATRLAPRLDGQVCKALLSQETLKERNEAGKDAQGRPTACDCAACHLFGSLDPQEANEERKGGRAARLWVFDAPLTGNGATNIRDAVGIDRRTGAAARVESVKFDLEVLQAGASFALRLELEAPSGFDEALLAAVLAEWQAGRAAVGGRVARGLGALALRDIQCRSRNFDSADELMAFLLSDDPQTGLTEHPTWLPQQLDAARKAVQPADERCNPYVARSWIEVEMTLQATGPFLAGDVTRARRAGFDHAPLIEQTGPVLPGASLRGVLRSHAERIARTLATIPAENSSQFGQRCPACSPVARPLNQATGEQVPLQVCDSLLRPSEDEDISENDLCLACQLFGSALLGSRLVAEDAPLKTGTEPVFKVQDFLAIDRFTGGGRDSAKFDAAALWRPAFTARMRLENPRAWELGWLALVLRDLAEGWLTVGFGRAKGYGQVVITNWTVRIGFLAPDDFPADLAEDAGGEPSDALPGALGELLAATDETSGDSVYHILTLAGAAARHDDGTSWSLTDGSQSAVWQQEVGRWVKQFNHQVSIFTRTAGNLPPLDTDTYFTGLIDRLYPKPMGGYQP